MTVYEKDKSFSVGWVFGGAIIMFFLNFFAGIVLAITGLALPLWLVVAVACVCFLVGGFIVGRWSAGQTILEGGIGAALAAGGTATLMAMRAGHFNPVVIGVGSLLPFVCGLLGAFIGEKVQGDTVEVQD